MAGLLSDVLPAVYSASNVMKNKLRGLLDDPLGTLQQALGDANDRARSFNELGARATAEDVASIKAGKGLGKGPASNELLAKIADAYNPMAMTVWHGSPHKFSKFDASKIGTGEGAQAYGHGLYLAESPEVAGEYARMNITGPGQVAHIGKKNGPDGAMQALKNAYPKMPNQWYESAIAKADDAGNTYKVDLPDDQIAKMLDWDNVVPEAQRASISQAALKQFGSGSTGTSGEHLYREVVKEFERAGHAAPKDAATAWLRQQGIPGIRYLDGGSRGTGAGSSNFVVFPGNEGMLTILERNGQPVYALRGLLAP